jgi:PKD repeat protein
MGDTSIRSSPQHKYIEPGEYTVILNVTNADGSNTISKNSFIKVYTDTQLTHPPHPIISLNVGKTKLNVRDSTFVTLSAENYILKPPMHIQVTIVPPHGVNVYSETFTDCGGGLYSSNFTLAAGENRAIILGIIPIEEGNLDIKGLARYYYGFDTANITTVELNQTIHVSASKPKYIPTPNAPQSTSTTTQLIHRFLKYFN